MVITANNIQHYELMQVLANKQPIQEAKTTPPITQTTLEENLLKLCSELRNSGFDIYADSVEDKFLALKASEVHLYHVHDEDGEDLIEFAHPDGDHNVEDGELGDVETIISQHKKMLEVVKKTPTGKLAQYVEMCRIVLAGEDKAYEIQLLESKRKQAEWNAKKIKTIVTGQGDLWSIVGSGTNFAASIDALINTLHFDPKGISIPSIEAASKYFGLVQSAIKGNLAPGGVVNPFSGVNKNISDAISGYMQKLTSLLTEMHELASKIYLGTGDAGSIDSSIANEESEPAAMLNVEDRAQKVSSLLSQLTTLQTQWHEKFPNAQQDAAHQKWFTDQDAENKNIKTQEDYKAAIKNMNDFATANTLSIGK